MHRGSSPPFARLPFGVPPTAYQKAGAAFILEVDAGDPWQATVNGQPYASGIGTGTGQLVSGLLTRAMVANPATYLVTTARGASASASGLVYGPDLLGALLNSWHDETGSYAAGTWTATAGGATKDLQTVTASPTTSTYLGRRTLVSNGTTQYLRRVFARSQPTEHWFAGRWLSAPIGNETIGCGGGPQGQIFTPSNVSLRIFAGATLLVATTNIANRWMVFGARFDNLNSAIIENGVTLATGPAGANDPGGLSFGGTGSGVNLCDAEVGEIITTTGLLDAFNLLHLPAYLATAWPP